MRRRRCLLGIVFVAIGLAGPTIAVAAQTVWTFEHDKVGRAPANFTFALTGQGRPGKWVVLASSDAPSKRVLAQIDTDPTDYRFPLAIANKPHIKDLRLSVQCKPLSGKVDQACGLVYRYKDQDNYYVTRANALEDNVRLYRMVGGNRQQIGGWNGKVAKEWSELRVEASGDHHTVFWNGKKVIETVDATFLSPGRVGLWTKADSVTYFAKLTMTER